MTTHSIVRLTRVESASATSVWITEPGGEPWKPWRFSSTVKTVARRNIDADRVFRPTLWGEWGLLSWEP